MTGARGARWNLKSDREERTLTPRLEDFPELEDADISACLAFAADREHREAGLPPQ